MMGLEKNCAAFRRVWVRLVAVFPVVVALFLVLRPDAMAQDSDPVLTIDYTGANGAVMRSVSLSREDLHALPRRQIETRTIWTRGPQRFEGVKIKDLLTHLGIDQGGLALHALNDYTVHAPADLLMQSGALLADTRNGQPMSPRGKGPVWLVFDYDSDSALQTETIYALSVWQLDRIEISR